MTDPQKLKQMALDLIKEQSTMALATARENQAWAAPVYYVFHKGNFYFFSDSQSRHIREAHESENVSAAIYPYADTWQGIRGLQMSGRIRSAGAGLTAIQALRAYIAKFPFTKEFFEPGQPLDLENFGKRFRVRFYRLEPDLIFYLDNHIKFGFREEIDLG
jgi:uncharacterized protein YhbP (UPF0306 family)